jgi:transcriptional regulator GlxA family with amidase domain
MRSDMALQTNDKRVRKALMIMTHSLRGNVSIADIAKRLSMSERQLERLFHEEFGCTPSSAYRQLRLQRGKWLLENTDRSITEIAVECGFSDGAHFARQVRTTFSSTPSDLRRQQLA